MPAPLPFKLPLTHVVHFVSVINTIMTGETMLRREETEIKISLKQVGWCLCLVWDSVLYCVQIFFEVDAFPNKVIERPSTSSSSRRLFTNQKLQKTKKNKSHRWLEDLQVEMRFSLTLREGFKNLGHGKIPLRPLVWACFTTKKSQSYGPCP